jgi:hypothetical protein
VQENSWRSTETRPNLGADGEGPAYACGLSADAANLKIVSRFQEAAGEDASDLEVGITRGLQHCAGRKFLRALCLGSVPVDLWGLVAGEASIVFVQEKEWEKFPFEAVPKHPADAISQYRGARLGGEGEEVIVIVDDALLLQREQDRLDDSRWNAEIFGELLYCRRLGRGLGTRPHETDHGLLKSVAKMIFRDADVNLAGEAGEIKSLLKEVREGSFGVGSGGGHIGSTRKRLGPAASQKSFIGWLPFSESGCRRVAAEPTMRS